MDALKENSNQISNVGKKMLIGLHLGNGYGSQPGAWRMPGVDPKAITVLTQG